MASSAEHAEREVLTLLERLERNRHPVDMEVERSHVRFGAVLSRRHDQVAVPRPRGLSSLLRKGTWVRFEEPYGNRRVVRMEIVEPEAVQPNGTVLFLCRRPEGFAGVSRRSSRRYGTQQLRNLSLEFSGTGRRYRVLDISTNGCRLLIHDREPETFPLGEQLPAKLLHVGENRETVLDAVVPRVHGERSLGCEMRVATTGRGKEHLDELLQNLHSEQTIEPSPDNGA